MKLDGEKSDTGGSCSYENSYAIFWYTRNKKIDLHFGRIFFPVWFDEERFPFSFFQSKMRVGLNEIQGQDWITFPDSGSISRNDYITAKKKCFAWLVAGQPCRKLREFWRYLLPGWMILSIIQIQIIFSCTVIYTPFECVELKFSFRRSLQIVVFRTRSTFSSSSSSILLHLFLWIFLRKEISSILSSLLPFYTLSRRRVG